MTKRMLIDAAHPEETRVVVLDGNRLEDFDYESASRKTLKGNIYLGKITRVEPSLQAAFVDYGGNRHGFLPFSDIHPDYYRIPIADREALLAEEAEHASAEDANGHGPNGHEANGPEANGPEANHYETNGQGPDDHADGAEAAADSDAEHPDEEDSMETVGGEEFAEPPRNLQRLRRTYKIQEVIKRRQVVLVQVTKEERGNKGAALTTFISLAGRYCVLMPNAIRGGGISRKITSAQDRRRLKEVVESLDVPEGMGVILRTAGMERSKAEIRRDYDFLVRVWEDIREKTFSSRAPALIYEEANLIKRTIRDIYSRDIEEVLVEGEEAYRTAKAFMRALMPSHARRVQLYKDRSAHIFPSFQIESQLDALHSPTVRLKSGGYIVINLTEALVAIDVNSGRATRERHIEETALRTNLEAATEIARQLRLRDLAGLIVIDFIDMEDRRNNAAVERRLKEAMRSDRARVQIGRISSLGLLEMSRQRLRPSLLETTMQTCPVCDGRGLVRTVESTAMHVFRAIEEEGARRRSAEIAVYVPTAVALYILNQKRNALIQIEREQGLHILVERDDTLISPAYRIEHLRAAPVEQPEAPEPAAEEAEAEAAPAAHAEEGPAAQAAEDEAERARSRRRGRRGGRRRGRRREDEAPAGVEIAVGMAEPAFEAPAAEAAGAAPSAEAPTFEAPAFEAPAAREEHGVVTAEPWAAIVEAPPAEMPGEAPEAPGPEAREAEAESEAPKEPRRRRRPRHRPRQEAAPEAAPETAAAAETVAGQPAAEAPEAADGGLQAEIPEPLLQRPADWSPEAGEPVEPTAPAVAATAGHAPEMPPEIAAAAENGLLAEAPEPALRSPAAWSPEEAAPAAREPAAGAGEAEAAPEAVEEPSLPERAAGNGDARPPEAAAPEPAPEPAPAAETGPEAAGSTEEEAHRPPAEPRPRRRGWWQRLVE